MIIPNTNPYLCMAVPGTRDENKLTEINTFGLFPIIAWDLEPTADELETYGRGPYGDPIPISFGASIHHRTAVYNTNDHQWWLGADVTGTGGISLITAFITLYEDEPPDSRNPVNGIFPIFE